MQRPQVKFTDLELIRYQDAWDLQSVKQKAIIDRKLENRNLEGIYPSVSELLFCQHPPVYTLGKSGKMENLLLNERGLDEKEIEFFKINRGGDITFHGPGQLVAYPIFDLDCFFNDVHRYVRSLEEVVIRTLNDYQLDGIRMKDFTGVWLEPIEDRPARKICAIGVHLSRWVSLHGLAFNVNTDLSYFNNIIPCGIADKNKTVTSLSQELGQELNLIEVKEKLLKHFTEVFNFTIIENEI